MNSIRLVFVFVLLCISNLTETFADSIKTLAVIGQAAPGGGVFRGVNTGYQDNNSLTFYGLQASRGGVLAFKSSIDGQGQGIFRYVPGTGFQIIAHKTSSPSQPTPDQDLLLFDMADDGRVAFWDPNDSSEDGICKLIVSPLSGTPTQYDVPCKGDAVFCPASAPVLAGNDVYFLARAMPTQPGGDCGEIQFLGKAGQSSPVTSLPQKLSPTNAEYALLGDDTGGVYVYQNAQDIVPKLSKLSGAAFTTVLGQGSPYAEVLSSSLGKGVSLGSAGVLACVKEAGNVDGIRQLNLAGFVSVEDWNSLPSCTLRESGSVALRIRKRVSNVSADGLELKDFVELGELGSDGSVRPLVSEGDGSIESHKISKIYLDYATAFESDGYTAFIADIVLKGTTTPVAALLVVEPTCPLQGPTFSEALNTYELSEVKQYQKTLLSDEVRNCKRSIQKLGKKPNKSKKVQTKISELKRRKRGLKAEQRKLAPLALADELVTDEDRRFFLLRATCTYIPEAAEGLRSKLVQNGKANQTAIADDFKEFADVIHEDKLTTANDPGQKIPKILKYLIFGIVSRVAGKDAAKLNEKAITLYETLAGKLKDKSAQVEQQKQIGDLINRLFKPVLGDKVAEFSRLVYVVYFVLRGEGDSEMKVAVIKEYVITLARKLFFDELLAKPQAWAFILGYEVGRTFGDPIAENLKVIMKIKLRETCLRVLAQAQGLEQRYAELECISTKATIPVFTNKERAKGLPPNSIDSDYGGYTCEIHTKAENYPKHCFIEAISPKSFYGAFGGEHIYFDSFYN